jgi:hypothetical protein
MTFPIPALPRWAWIALAAALAAFLLWRALDSYGDRRYDQGVTDTDAKWEEASARLKAQAAQSATRADDAAAKRLDEFKTQVEDERKALDEAERTGSSPLDVLFGS